MMMSHDNDNPGAPARQRSQQPTSRSIFDVPAPIKQLFDKFPLLTYPINHLPQRAPQHRNSPVLHIFTTREGASRGVPSYNPACLKWQVRTHGNSYSLSYTHTTTDIPQVFQYQFPSQRVVQPCVSKWRSSIPPSCAARHPQARTASTVWQASAMDHEQQ